MWTPSRRGPSTLVHPGPGQGYQFRWPGGFEYYYGGSNGSLRASRNHRHITCIRIIGHGQDRRQEGASIGLGLGCCKRSGASGTSPGGERLSPSKHQSYLKEKQAYL